MRSCHSLSVITRRIHRKAFANDKSTILPECMSAWQTLGYAKPGTSDVTEQLHCTQTRRLPLITRPDHLLIDVHATSLNPVDLLCLSGYGSTTFSYARYFGSFFGLMGLPNTNGSEFPYTPGRDFSGHVVDSSPTALNHCCTSRPRFSIGDRVAGATWPFLSTTGSGAMAHYVVCPAGYVAHIPDNVSWDEAAAIGYAGLTGWSALSAGDLKPSTTQRCPSVPLVLVAGATGGVGLAAAQLAKIWGCRVHVTCPDDVKAQSMMEQLEFENVIVHPDLPPASTKYDVIIDCVRPPQLSKALTGSIDDLQSTAQVLFPDLPPLFSYLSSHSSARYVSLNSSLLLLMDRFGMAAGAGLAITQRLGSQLLGCSPFGADSLGQLRWAFFKPSGLRLDSMLRLASRGLFKVYIDEVFPFEQVPVAFERLSRGGIRGKLVVRVSKE